jgi:hypothetical protein
MTTDEAIAWMWERKVKYQDMFMHAELVEETTFNPGGSGVGNQPYTMPAGTKVLVTVYSRLGHVCLRCKDVDRLEHGYDLGLDPEKLTNYRPAAVSPEAVR